MKKIAKLFGILSFIFISTPLLACDVCSKQQPRVLKNITHGAGPQGQEDYIIIVSAIVIVLFTLFFSIKYLVKPGEKSPQHVKNIVIDNL